MMNNLSLILRHVKRNPPLLFIFIGVVFWVVCEEAGMRSVPQERAGIFCTTWPGLVALGVALEIALILLFYIQYRKPKRSNF